MPEYIYRYLFEDIDTGTYTIRFSKENYETLTQTVTLAPGNNELNVELVPISVPELELVDYYWDASQPFQASSTHRLTMVLRNISPKEYTYDLTLGILGIATLYKSFHLAPNESVTWNPLITMPSYEGTFTGNYIRVECEGEYITTFAISNVEVYAAPPAYGTLWGYVKDAVTGVPITASLSASAFVGIFVFADASGRYSATVYAPATIYGDVHAPGYESYHFMDIIVGEGETVRRDFYLTPL